MEEQDMTETEKEKIRFWRCEGLSYGMIADRLHLSANTVKSFCRRNHLAGVAASEPVLVCRNCGAPLDLNATAKCQYCGAVIQSADFDWVIKTIKGISQQTSGR